MKDKALGMALEFFETMKRYKRVRSNIFIRFEPTATGDYLDLREFDERAEPTITAIKQALAAPVQEPCDMGNICAGCSPRNADGSCPHEKANLACDCYEKGFNDGMKEIDGMGPYTTPQPQRKPIQNLQCFHCQDTIETLNDKVMQLMAKRTWVGLTDEEIEAIWYAFHDREMGYAMRFTRAIEAKLKQKNGY